MRTEVGRYYALCSWYGLLLRIERRVRASQRKRGHRVHLRRLKVAEGAVGLHFRNRQRPGHPDGSRLDEEPIPGHDLVPGAQAELRCLRILLDPPQRAVGVLRHLATATNWDALFIAAKLH